MDPVTGLEPVPPAWKAGMLATDTTPSYKIYLSSLYKYYTTIFEKNQIFTRSNSQVGVVI